MKRAFFLLLLAAGFAASGRAQSAPPEQSNKQIIPYQIITNDRITVSVFEEPDLQIKDRVDASGNVNCGPLIGEIHLYGLTIQEAQRKIEDAYRNDRILRRPKVTVTVPEPAPRNVSVTGRVRNPGRFPLDVETAVTLPEIIIRAGGFDDTARGSAVTLTRVLPDGRTEVKVFDVQAVLKGKGKNNPASTFLLMPDDIIYVPQRII